MHLNSLLEVSDCGPILNQSDRMKKTGLKLIWIALALTNIVCKDGLAETEHSGSSETQSESSSQVKIRVNAAMYSARKGEFRDFCASLASDGRLETFSQILVLLLDNNIECLECKAFFKTFISTCKPATPKVAKARTKRKSKEHEEAVEEEEPTPTPEPTPTNKPRQREPNGLLIDYASTIFAGIANSPLGEITLKPFDLLLAALRDPAGKSAAEHEYFVTLAGYMDSGYLELRKELHAESADSDKDAVVNSLFSH